MHTTADVVAILAATFSSILITLCVPFLFLGAQGKAEEAKARARRLADARMNARLLRLNL